MNRARKDNVKYNKFGKLYYSHTFTLRLNHVRKDNVKYNKFGKGCRQPEMDYTGCFPNTFLAISHMSSALKLI
jgi:hypothetical protein